jgi:hypothetical protein
MYSEYANDVFPSAGHVAPKPADYTPMPLPSPKEKVVAKHEHMHHKYPVQPNTQW